MEYNTLHILKLNIMNRKLKILRTALVIIGVSVILFAASIYVALKYPYALC